MNGRQEKDLKTRALILRNLEGQPKILTEYFNDLVGDGKSYSTILTYVRFLCNFAQYFGGLDDFYNTTTTPDIKAYLATFDGEENRALHWSALNSFFGFCVMNGYLGSNPMRMTKRNKIRVEHEVTWLTQEEITNILCRIDNETNDPERARDRTIILLALSTALRVGAISQINVSDINFQTHRLSVIEKEHKVRQIPLGKNIEIELNKWLKERQTYNRFDPNNDALFISSHGTRICEQSIRNIVTKYTDDLGKKITPHKFRSTAATTLAACGANIATIKEVLGHEKIETSMRYVRAIEKDKQQAFDLLDNIANQ